MEPIILPHSALTTTQFKVLNVVLPSAALVCTVIRLLIKYRRRNSFGWDDIFAILAAIASALGSVCNFIHNVNSANFSHSTRLFGFYGLTETFYVGLWSARLSMLFSIIRIVPDYLTKRFLQATAVVFGLLTAILSLQVVWVCERQHGWKDDPRPQCVLGDEIGITQLVTDIIADLILILVPVRLLLRTNLVRSTKIRLVVLFGAAALTTVASVVHIVFILLINHPVEAALSGIIETSVATIVCNLIVLVPALWRSFGLQEHPFPEAICLTDYSTRIKFATQGTHTAEISITPSVGGQRPDIYSRDGSDHPALFKTTLDITGPVERQSNSFEGKGITLT